MTVIKIKRGPTVPTTSNLESYELGFVTSSGAENLYINNGGTITRLGIKVITGTNAPTTQGVDNDIYVQYTTSGNDTEIDAVFVKVSGSWIELPAGGASVLMGTTDPTAAMGEDGNLYVKYHIDSNVPSVDGFFVKISGAWASVSSGSGDSYLELTQAEYDALTPAEKNNGTIYFITDTNGDGEDFQPIIYSLEEREIGVWTDGKPLYEITLTNTANAQATNSSWSSVSWANEPSNIDVLVSAELHGTNGNSVPNLWNTLRFGMDGGHVKIASLQSGALNANSHLTIRYTKTTDTAGSGTWTPQGVPAVHYSEDEHVIGTWIDGSALYEKTFYRALPTSGGTQNVSFAHGISNLNIIVERSISNFIRTGESVGTDGTFQYYTSIQSIDGTNITYKTTVDGAGRYVIITIRYTKTA